MPHKPEHASPYRERKNGYCMERNGAALLRITGYAGHAGISSRLKCTGDGGLACWDEARMQGLDPDRVFLMQRNERFLVFFLIGFPKWFSTRAEEEPLNLVWQRSRGRSHCRAFPLQAYIPSGGRRFFAAVMTCCLFRAQLSWKGCRLIRVAFRKRRALRLPVTPGRRGVLS